MTEKNDIVIRELVVGPLATNCFVISCPVSREALIIDPGGNAGSIKGYVDEAGLKPVKIVLTHGHSDHMAAAAELKKEYGIGLSMHADDMDTMKKSIEDAPLWGLGTIEDPGVDEMLVAGDEIRFGEASVRVLHTPGHTRGGISLYTGKEVFAGDTLFARSIGRTDFFGGDMETLLDSIRTQLFTLPEDTTVYCGHGPSTDIGAEKAQNPFLNGYF